MIAPEQYVTNIFPIEINAEDSIDVLKIPSKYLRVSSTLLKKYLMNELRNRQLLDDVRIGFGFRGAMYMSIATDEAKDYISRTLAAREFLKDEAKDKLSFKKFNLDEHALPIAQVVHERILEKLSQCGWILIHRYRMFKLEFEYKDVPEPFNDFIKVFRAIEARTIAFIQRKWLDDQYGFKLGIAVDPRIRIEPSISLLEIGRNYSIKIESILTTFSYVITFCPVLDCIKKLIMLTYTVCHKNNVHMV